MLYFNNFILWAGEDSTAPVVTTNSLAREVRCVHHSIALPSGRQPRGLSQPNNGLLAQSSARRILREMTAQDQSHLRKERKKESELQNDRASVETQEKIWRKFMRARIKL